MRITVAIRETGLVMILTVMLTVGCGPRPTPTVEIIRYPPSPTPPSTLPELIEVLSGYNAEARIGAARALGAMGAEAEAAVPVLSKNLYYEGPSAVREAAAWALGEIGPTAKPAVPILIVVLLTDSVHARETAAVALGKIGDLAAVPALASGLYDESLDVRISSAEAIARLAGQSFPGTPPSSQGGYSLSESGEAIIVLAAREWWEEEGRRQDWSQAAVTPIPRLTPALSTPTP